MINTGALARKEPLDWLQQSQCPVPSATRANEACSCLLAAVRRNGLHAVPTEMRFLASTEE